MRCQLIDLPGLQKHLQRQRYLSSSAAAGFTGFSGHGAMGIGRERAKGFGDVLNLDTHADSFIASEVFWRAFAASPFIFRASPTFTNSVTKASKVSSEASANDPGRLYS
jgi:hypothetical protein